LVDFGADYRFLISICFSVLLANRTKITIRCVFLVGVAVMRAIVF